MVAIEFTNMALDIEIMLLHWCKLFLHTDYAN